jgi:hypothetical protein
MNRRHLSSELHLLLTAIAFGIAIASFLGLILHDDHTGRFLFGTTWSLVGVWWLGRYLDLKKPSRDLPRRSQRDRGL